MIGKKVFAWQRLLGKNEEDPRLPFDRFQFDNERLEI